MTHVTPPHYIRENKAARVPKRLIVLHVQPQSDRTGEREVQTWRCGAAMYIHWTSKGHMHDAITSYTSMETLWDDVTDFTRPKQRTVLYAHNLPVTLRLSNALHHLPARGWHLESIRVASQGTWSRWTRQRATLVVVDSGSVFPVTIHTLGLWRALGRLPIPDEDTDSAWMARAARDCGIVAATLVEYFDWLRTGVAGNWQLTGAGQAWAHWRHGHYTHQLLCHADPDATAAERRAMFTGRAENWVWGRDYDRPVYEWDWSNAYPRIARDVAVPCRLTSSITRATHTDLRALTDRFIVLADLEVTTTKPVVPARHDGRILWPVGTFTTTLWWPEIEALERAGGTYRVLRAWLYRPAPALAQWGSWVLDQLHGHGETGPRWRTVVLKHWSRALIGRFATQYQNWELFGYDPVAEVRTGQMHDTDTGEDGEFMQVGHEIHVMTGLSESDDSCPQITSFIMSVARARLWDAIGVAGWDHVLYMDTDSLVVDMNGHKRLRKATDGGRLPGLRLKDRHNGYEIYGPRAAVIGSRETLSGVPRNPVRTGDTTWVGEVWTQFERALRIGEHDRVTIQPRKFSVKWNEHRRARGLGGTTVPYRLPEYQPAIPVLPPEPVLESEIVDRTRRQLRGKTVPGAGAARRGDGRAGDRDRDRAGVVAAALGRPLVGDHVTAH